MARVIESKAELEDLVAQLESGAIVMSSLTEIERTARKAGRALRELMAEREAARKDVVRVCYTCARQKKCTPPMYKGCYANGKLYWQWQYDLDRKEDPADGDEEGGC